MNATILGTATVGGAFLAGAGDGSGRLVGRIDPLLFAPVTLVARGARPDAPGALDALGGDVWRLWPRDVAEYRNP
jgi:hypothetical protein